MVYGLACKKLIVSAPIPLLHVSFIPHSYTDRPEVNLKHYNDVT